MSRTVPATRLVPYEPHSDRDGLVKPLTPAELEVAECRGKGWDCPRIAEYLGIKRGTVRSHIKHAAMKMANPDALDPMDLVLLWAAHRAWRHRHAA